MSSTLLIYAFSDMQSEKPNLGQPGDARKTKIPRDYMCNRASGLSAALQNQRSMESEKVAETVSHSSFGQNLKMSYQT